MKQVNAPEKTSGTFTERQLPRRELTTPAVVAPFVLYLLGTSVAGRFEGSQYSVAYGVVALLVAIVAVWQLRGTVLFRIHARVLAGVAVGVVGIGLWIWLSELRLEERLGAFLPEGMRPEPRVSFNPFDDLESRFSQILFVGVRLFGLALVVPLAEEIFWRGFLMRWIIDPDWQRVPLGAFTWRSSWIVIALFTLAHPEWLAAAVYCGLINGLLHWKRDLWQCIIAHATSNLLLGLYVLWFKAWWLW